MLDGDAAGDCKGGAFARSAPLLGFFWPFSCRNKKRANNPQYGKLKFETTPVLLAPGCAYSGFLAVIVEDMMNSPTERERPHFSSYSRETGFSFTETSSNPQERISFSNSSTEEAPLTQQECMLGSFFSSSGICFMMTMSQMEIRPPGFNTR